MLKRQKFLQKKRNIEVSPPISRDSGLVTGTDYLDANIRRKFFFQNIGFFKKYQTKLETKFFSKYSIF